MNTCEATPSAAQEIRIQSLGTPEIDSPLSRNLATAGERRVVFTVDEELVDEGAAPRPMSFELAGPRDRIYFDPSKTKCAIVTCGGLCPGINDVIRAIVMTAYNAYRVPSVLGIRYGLQGFIPSSATTCASWPRAMWKASTSSGGRSSGRPEGRSLHPKSPPPLSA